MSPSLIEGEPAAEAEPEAPGPAAVATGGCACPAWAKLVRDAVAVVLGIVAGVFIIARLVPAVRGNGGTPTEVAAAPSGTGLRSGSARAPELLDPPGGWKYTRSVVAPVGPPTEAPRENGGPSYAFVQMAFDDGAGEPQRLWRVVAMARAIQRLSIYPLVLMTTATHFHDGTPVVRAMSKLNVHVLPIKKLSPRPEEDTQWSPYWKLHVFELLGFKKLIWLDTDAILFRSIDWLFEREPAWEEVDGGGACPNVKRQKGNHGALMLLEPRLETFRGLMEYVAAAQAKGLPADDVQGLIGEYFAQVEHNPMKALEASEATAGQCLDLRQDADGRWSMPAFVHRSSPLNTCFNPNTTAQLANVSGAEVNRCHYHPLGSYWRDLFCDGAKTAAVSTPMVAEFCDDRRWFGVMHGNEAEAVVASSLSICSRDVGIPPDRPPPTFKVTPAANRRCFHFIQKKSEPMTLGGTVGRNWCWEGLKEYGCHWHLWEHRTWKEMREEALHIGGIFKHHFHPLQESHLCENREAGATREWSEKDWANATAWFERMVSVYVLGMESATDRTALVKQHLSKLRISFELVLGFDLRVEGDLQKARDQGIIPESFNVSWAQEEALQSRNNMGFIAGTVGCASGHFRVQLHAAKHEAAKPISLIFEDDVVPEEDFIPRLWSLVTEELPCDWQALSLRSGCPYGHCISKRLSRVMPDANEPRWRCRHGVNYGFQGMLYRTSEILDLQKIWKPVVFNEETPHCLDVDVALASISDQVRYYAVPAVQDPGFLKETDQASARWSINQEQQADKVSVEQLAAA